MVRECYKINTLQPQNTDRECYEYPLPLFQYRTEPQNVQNEGGILENFNKNNPRVLALSRQPTTLKPKQYTQFLTLAGSLKPLPNTRGVFRKHSRRVLTLAGCLESSPLTLACHFRTHTDAFEAFLPEFPTENGVEGRKIHALPRSEG